MQVGITLEAVERDILAWDYFSVISGEATREGVAAAGIVPVSFSSLSAYSKVCSVHGIPSLVVPFFMSPWVAEREDRLC